MVKGFAVKTPLWNLYNLLPIYGDGAKLYSEWYFLAVSSEPVVNRLRTHVQSFCVLVCEFLCITEVCFN